MKARELVSCGACTELAAAGVRTVVFTGAIRVWQTAARAWLVECTSRLETQAMDMAAKSEILIQFLAGGSTPCVCDVIVCVCDVIVCVCES